MQCSEDPGLLVNNTFEAVLIPSDGFSQMK
jgi:hypothetical protein